MVKMFSVFVVVGLLCLPCSGQTGISVGDAFDGTVYIVSGRTSCTGFVVAREGDRAEVWTTQHGIGKNGSVASVTFSRGTEREFVANAIVHSQGNGGDSDWAKLVVMVGKHPVKVLEVGSDSDMGGDCFTVGYPQGTRLVASRIRIGSECAFGFGYRFKPSPVNGQSGSPILKDNKVVAFIMGWRQDDRTGERWGICLPISTLKNDYRGSVEKPFQRRPIRRIWNAG